MKEKRIISILGDSVSTFEGMTPPDAVFYGTWNAEETGVITQEDTWWMQVIRALDASLGVNHSLAGSLVTGRTAVSGTSERRIRSLGENGDPDMILVAMGANDWGFRVLPEEFREEYRRMLLQLKRCYPQADIRCATLPEGILPEESWSFFDVDGCISRRVYSDIIRTAANEAEVGVVALDGTEYPSIDGVHPNKDGMDVLARAWIRSLREGGIN